VGSLRTGALSTGEGAERGGLTGPNPTDRGKLATKRHVLTDGHGVPIAVAVTGANVHDKWVAGETLDNVPPPHASRGPRRPRNLCLDKGSGVVGPGHSLPGAVDQATSAVRRVWNEQGRGPRGRSLRRQLTNTVVAFWIRRAVDGTETAGAKRSIVPRSPVTGCVGDLPLA
jgi:hypothetical protein